MRIKHFFGLAVIAAMTASCSSNNDLVNGGNGSGENETGASYASFTINLPTTRGTRADNPEFKPGETNEYDFAGFQGANYSNFGRRIYLRREC